MGLYFVFSFWSHEEPIIVICGYINTFSCRQPAVPVSPCSPLRCDLSGNSLQAAQAVKRPSLARREYLNAVPLSSLEGTHPLQTLAAAVAEVVVVISSFVWIRKGRQRGCCWERRSIIAVWLMCKLELSFLWILSWRSSLSRVRRITCSRGRISPRGSHSDQVILILGFCYPIMEALWHAYVSGQLNPKHKMHMIIFRNQLELNEDRCGFDQPYLKPKMYKILW